MWAAMYRLWTDKDLTEYRSYLQNIQFEQLGSVNIGGVYSKQDLAAERSVQAYIFRVYDYNVSCSQRRRLEGPGTAVTANGVAKGLVVSLAKDKQTDSFFTVNQAVVASPAAIWIHRYYTGGAQLVADQTLAEHQGKLQSQYCAVGEGKKILPLLTYDHMDRYILPSLLESFSKEIKACDQKRSV